MSLLSLVNSVLAQLLYDTILCAVMVAILITPDAHDGAMKSSVIPYFISWADNCALLSVEFPVIVYE